MCVELRIDGERVSTMRELVKIVPMEKWEIDPCYPDTIPSWDRLDTCLCPLNVEATAARAGYDIVEHDVSMWVYVLERRKSH